MGDIMTNGRFIMDKSRNSNTSYPLNSREAVRLKDVTFSYNDKPVLENVSLSVRAGDFLALIGPNGAAKSTLMKIMLGLLRPKTGEVKLFGQDVGRFRDWKRVGYISQQAGHINTAFPATVEEVVASGFYSGFGRFFNAFERKRAVKQTLESVGIYELSDRLMGELSGGQRQKVFLAKALVKKPEALFLDEPTTGIDTASQTEFYQLLLDLNKNEKVTIVIITHDIAAAFGKAKKIGCVRDRKVYIHEDINEITQEHIAEVLGYRILRD
ncbi:High-affinity zinc uptake system ATP-binding protein ZnuC [Koleobacter methoxysyntrophicus]|uniref:High-affinity zinc uptake system ATP-binding protein ZnuC n=2 Tax=Koleobacter methoxysyntrophicus TaxID=2751313 RepID=A0A8A0RL36_9FIRM|nr:High-affinity zinc uptake system ATP-binding protein ZnuC [Koleobacter methoxysyntrophicus]